MAMQQASQQETITHHIKKEHRKTDEDIPPNSRSGSVASVKDSLEPVFVPMKQDFSGIWQPRRSLLYPPLEKEMKQEIADALEQHDEIRKHLDNLTASGTMPEAEWMRHLQTMKQEITHHVQEEEREILPAVERMFDRQKSFEAWGRVRAD